MKQLPREQRPYEKCFMQGEGSLNDTELLAVILRSGTSGKNSLALAQEILKFMEKNCQGCCQTADSYEQSLLHSSLLYGRTPP